MASALLAGGIALAFAAGTTAAPQIGGCPVFPDDNIWNVPADRLPLDPNSSAYVNSIGAGAGLKFDFGAGLWNGGPIGIPYVIVPQNQPRVPVTFDYWDESDPGPYPIPANPPIEGGNASTGDRHILMVEQGTCGLFELYAAYPPGTGWTAGSGAIFDLNSNTLRPDTWTSGDAAGLPILPGLVRYDEVAAGEIRHALRFTVPSTQRRYVWPGRHFASSSTNPALPPMGQRFRLKASYDISRFDPQVQVILRALKRYGMMVSDNGSPWFITGVPDERWNNTILNSVQSIPGSAFEAVDQSILMVNADSGQAKRHRPPRIDFNRDGRHDALWWNSATGTALGWRVSGGQFAGSDYLGTADPSMGWQPVAVGDFGADGSTDLVWRNGTGAVVVWSLEGANRLASSAYVGTAGSDWSAVGVADFDNDGRDDIVWRNAQTGDLVVWQMDGARIRTSTAISPTLAPGSGWVPLAIADVDGDGKPDVIWRSVATGGRVFAWLMNGFSPRADSGSPGSAGSGWTFIGTGDVDGDGRADLLWRHTDGSINVWLMNGATFKPASGLIGRVDASWTVAAIGDYDGDGKADILWRHTSGNTLVWLLNGAQITGTRTLPAASAATGWNPVAP